MLRTRCPRCRTLVTARDLGACPNFPFCSKKCRMADLDRWFTEDYVVRGDVEEDGSPDRE